MQINIQTQDLNLKQRYQNLVNARENWAFFGLLLIWLSGTDIYFQNVPSFLSSLIDPSVATFALVSGKFVVAPIGYSLHATLQTVMFFLGVLLLAQFSIDYVISKIPIEVSAKSHSKTGAEGGQS